MRFAARHRPQKSVQFAERIFGINAKDPDDPDGAFQGIDRFEDFLKRIGCPTRLSELDIDGTLITRCAQDTLRIIHDKNGSLPGRPPMSQADIVAVLDAAR